MWRPKMKMYCVLQRSLFRVRDCLGQWCFSWLRFWVTNQRVRGLSLTATVGPLNKVFNPLSSIYPHQPWIKLGKRYKK